MKTISIIGLVLFVVISLVASSCKEEALEIQKAYAFKVTHLPIPLEVPENGTVEIRCTIESEGNYKDVLYNIRFFQNKGKGQLYLENRLLSVPNDLYPIGQKVFRLYYKAQSTKKHQFDIYIVDNFGQTRKVSFEFRSQTDK